MNKWNWANLQRDNIRIIKGKSQVNQNFYSLNLLKMCPAFVLGLNIYVDSSSVTLEAQIESLSSISDLATLQQKLGSLESFI